MNYLSTRGAAPIVSFEDALLNGLAHDGGLYVPETYPQLSKAQIKALSGKTYQQVALAVISPFIGGWLGDEPLGNLIDDAYRDFRHPAIAPLVQSGINQWMLDLHCGPTLAFKDLAMQLVARLMDRALGERGRRSNVICATSGDTGGAAVAAFAGRACADLFVLFPKGRVSDVQRRMMTTSKAENVCALEIDGTFDDCQTLVKALFKDSRFRDEMSLSGVNSINWARVMAQTVYYFASAVALGAPDREVSFTVPTGNFGNILAGYVAKRMGLGIGRLVIATNSNDILVRTLGSGYHETSSVHVTTSPSMDIQISSNFERLIFDIVGRDSKIVCGLMNKLAKEGSYQLDEAVLSRLCDDFDAGSCDEEETLLMIKNIYDVSGMVVDPHTAVGLAVARLHQEPATPMVVLSTAHAAKFPSVVQRAAGVDPQIPAQSRGHWDGHENIIPLKNNLCEVMETIRYKTHLTAGTIR